MKKRTQRTNQLLTNNTWLAEQTIKIFLDYYFPLEWIKEFILDARADRFLQIPNSAEDQEFENNLLLCRKSFNLIFPTAKGINNFFEMIQTTKSWTESFHNLSYCDETRFLLYFNRKAIEANHAGHSTLSALWKMLTMKELNTWSAWLVFATVKYEESRIMGYEEDRIYWEEMKGHDDRFKRIASFCRSNILSIINYHEKRANEEEWIKAYKHRAEEAGLRGNKELSVLWKMVADLPNFNNLSTKNFFLAAWSLTKSFKPDQEAPALWKAAALHFQKAKDVDNQKIASEYIILAKEVTKQIQNFRVDSLLYLDKARKPGICSEISDFYSAVALHTTEKAHHLRRIVALEYHDNYSYLHILDRVRSQWARCLSHPWLNLDHVVENSMQHLHLALRSFSMIANLLKYGYKESSRVLEEESSHYTDWITEYFHGLLLAEKARWNPLSTSGCGISTQSQLDMFQDKLIRFRRLFQAYESYLRSIIQYAALITSITEDTELVPPTDAQILNVLEIFTQRILENITWKPTDEDMLLMIRLNYDQVVDCEDKAQKSAKEGDLETSKRYHILEKGHLIAAKWSVVMFQKKISKKEGFIDKALQMIQSAELLLRKEIQTKKFVNSHISKAHKLQKAAELILLAELSENE